jgi:WD40 repeat protein/uncharacterized caspase-like protein
MAPPKHRRLVLLATLAVALTAPAAPASERDSDAARPQLTITLGHVTGSLQVAYSPDGRYLATMGGDRRIVLWDVATGAELRRFAGPENSYFIAVSPDGRHVAAAGAPEGVWRWDAASGKRIASLEGPTPAESVAWAPSGDVIVTSHEDGAVWLWDASSAERLRRLDGFSEKSPARPLAFSRDGRVVAAGGRSDDVVLWEVATGSLLRRLPFDDHLPTVLGGAVTSIAFSPDGRHVAAGFTDGHVIVWDAESGAFAHRFYKHFLGSQSVAFSPDGRTIASAGGDAMVYLWDAASGAEIRVIQTGDYSTVGGAVSVAFAPDGRTLTTANVETVPRSWDVATGAEVRRFEGRTNMVQSLAVSADGRMLATGGASGAFVCVWDLAAGVERRRFDMPRYSVHSVAFSPDGRLVAAGGDDGSMRDEVTARVWDVATGAEALRFVPADAERRTGAFMVAFAPDGKTFATSDWIDGAARTWDLATGVERRRFTLLNDPAPKVSALRQGLSTEFTRDGRFLVTAAEDLVVRVWDTATGAQVRRFDGNHAMCSPDGRYAAVTSLVLDRQRHGGIRFVLTVWELATGNEVGQVPGLALCWSADGRRLLVQPADGSAVFVWDVASKTRALTLQGDFARIQAAATSPDGSFYFTTSDDGAVRLWEAATGRELCQLMSFADGTWIVTDPEGRFDTNAPDEIRALHWVLPDDPFRPLPVEVFMREYYEPRLLARILAGERLAAVRSIAALNRAQPLVRILDVAPTPGEPDAVTVRVEVSRVGRSGVHDLRLFRDGHLVGYAPERGGEVAVDEGTGSAVVTFAGVRLPRVAGLERVELSAYAFNDDRVKSVTDRRTYDLPKGLTPVKGRAFCIGIGVNAYEDPSLNLRFAVNDAREMQRLIAERLARTGRYEEVVPVALVSDAATPRTATKANVKAVFDLLAGRPVDPKQLAGISGASRLRQARPEDVVFIAFAGHGYADGRGNFYVVPHDIGRDARARLAAVGEGRLLEHVDADGPGVLDRCISSEELSQWLRDVDAGDMILVIDACQSAALTGESFKPGPMGSRGLGQLAYDKGMRVLAATQADNVALELKRLQHGLLTYALLSEGLEAHRADFQPADSTIWVSEWLSYAVERVPALFREIENGKVRSVGAVRPKIRVRPQRGLQLEGAARPVQQPALFDFSRRRRDIVLSRNEPQGAPAAP